MFKSREGFRTGLSQGLKQCHEDLICPQVSFYSWVSFMPEKQLLKALNMNLSSFKSSRKEHAPPLDSASNIDHGPILEPIAVAGKHNLLFSRNESHAHFGVRCGISSIPII